MGLNRKVKRNRLAKYQEKNMNLTEINHELQIESDKIKDSINKLQDKYGFNVNYNFNPITINDLKNFKG